jgi:hypothetical protein
LEHGLGNKLVASHANRVHRVGALVHRLFGGDEDEGVCVMLLARLADLSSW